MCRRINNVAHKVELQSAPEHYCQCAMAVNNWKHKLLLDLGASGATQQCSQENNASDDYSFERTANRLSA